MKQVRNEFYGKMIDVPDGYEVCSRCKGSGYHNGKIKAGLRCWVCGGEGILDWIEYIMKRYKTTIKVYFPLNEKEK